MSAWGFRPFENDAAADWALECARQADVAFVEATLDQMLAADDDLDADDAEEGIAAAATVARLLGHRVEAADPVSNWITRDRPDATPALAAKADEALDRVLAEPSELLELWAASDDYAEWQDMMNGLKALLK